MSKEKKSSKENKLKNQKPSTKAVTTYLKKRGIDTVLKECGNNLRVFRIHLRRVCNLDKSVKLYNIQLQAKAVLKDRLKEYGSVVQAVDKFLEDNFGGNNGQERIF